MSKTLVAVRDVDEDMFRRFRAAAVEERMKAGDALTSAMELWVKKRMEEKIKKPSGIRKIKPVSIGGKKVSWSGEIDETLYG